MINNAASPIHGLPLFDDGETGAILAPGQVAATVSANSRGYFNTLSCFLPGVTNAASRQSARGATVVTVSSILAHLCPAGLADYAASKAACSALHHTLSHELRRRGWHHRVKTILVESGHIDTGLFRDKVEVPWYAQFLGPTLDTNDVAARVVTMIEGGQSGLIRIPVYAWWIGTFYSCLPGALQLLIRWLSGIDEAVSRPARGIKES